MNNPKDIIVILKQNEDSFDSTIKTEQLDDEINYWISYLKEKIQKRLYKRALKEICTRQLTEKYKVCPRGWEIIILSIKTKLKIIKNKIKKHNLNPKEKQKPKLYQINQCKKFFEAIQEDFNELFSNKESENIQLINNLNMTDELILCYAQYIHLSSFFHKRIGNYIESLNYLILIIKFYKELNLIIKSPITLYYISICFISLSQLYISNEDYSSALEYLNIAAEISYKIILFQVDDIYNGVYNKINTITTYSNIHNKNEPKIKDLKLIKIFANIVVLFIFKGICYENFGNIKNAVRCYKQSLWFGSKFLKKNDDNLFISFIKNLNWKSNECNLAFDILVKKINDYEKINLLKTKVVVDDNKNKKIDYNKYYELSDKYRGLIKKLENLKIKEIDTVNRFAQKKNIKFPGSNRRAGEDKNIYLGNIKLLQAYLRSDFRSIILDMDKVKLFDLDYNLRERIQKKIYRINFEQVIQDKKEINKELVKKKSLKYFLQAQKQQKGKKTLFTPDNRVHRKKVQENKKYKSVPIIPSTPNSKNMNKKKNSGNINKNQNNKSNNIKNTLKEQTSFLNRTTFQQSSKQPKIFNLKNNKNKYFTIYNENNLNMKEIKSERKMNQFFNRNYLKKRDFIKHIEEKELKFQKIYLLSKRKPKPSIPRIDELSVKRSAYNSFNVMKTLVNLNSVNNEDNGSRLEEESKLNNGLCKSMGYKSLGSYLERRRNKKDKTKKEELIYNSDYEVEKNNKSLLNKLNEKLNIINEIQNKKCYDSLYYKMKNQKRLTHYKMYTSISPNKFGNNSVIPSSYYLKKKSQKI